MRQYIADSPAAIDTAQVKRNLGKSGLESEGTEELLKAKTKNNNKAKKKEKEEKETIEDNLYSHLSRLTLSKEHMDQAKFLVDCGIWGKFKEYMSSRRGTLEYFHLNYFRRPSLKSELMIFFFKGTWSTCFRTVNLLLIGSCHILKHLQADYFLWTILFRFDSSQMERDFILSQRLNEVMNTIRFPSMV